MSIPKDDPSSTMHACSDVESFSSIWSALRSNYRGTNITATVARLLHMYQPKDGILAYEHLLKTLCILLEGFDRRRFQSLASMIPTPKNVNDGTVREVFFKVTGFDRIDQTTSQSVENTPETAKTIFPVVPSSSKISELQKKKENLQQVMESDVFRGFPNNEISTTLNHVENMNNCSGSLNKLMGEKNAFPAKFECWLKTCVLPKKVRCSYEIQRLFANTMNDNFYKLPIVNSNETRPSEICSKSHLRQVILPNKNIGENCSLPSCSKSNFNSPALDGKVNRELETRVPVDLINDGKYFLDENNIKNGFQIKSQAIQADLHKMDVVYWNENNHRSAKTEFWQEEEDLLSVNNELKQSIKKFLMRMEKDTSIDFPIAKALSPKAKSIKLEKNDTSKFQTIGAIDNSMSCRQNSKKKKNNNPRKLDSYDFLSNINGKSHICQTNQMINYPRHKYGEYQTPDIAGLPHRLFAEANTNVKYVQHIAPSMTAMKKQYYNTMLSRQNTKGIPNATNIGTVAGYDPYYLNYLRHQYQMLQQQQHRLMMSPQYAMHTLTPTGLSKMFNAPYTWVRYDNFNHPFLRQTDLHQQHQQHYEYHSTPLYPTRSQDYEDPLSEKLDWKNWLAKNGEPTKRGKRKKLEDIIGKLKDVERNGISN